ncbi:substrate-binding domain-containing protein [Vulcanisaeta sp. JCM 16161]|uniref:substrate-binding domain-containing protein n=1 Tax=Vulcanisaeta sp. JCM 16161 TaxID=1295372 RepID=UPI000ADCF30E|nr:substrate-binding domain-containing protein [Vulcanisaeta sp. JCM 16161]
MRGFTVYVETIPPGLVLRRALGEPLIIGDLVIDVRPDIVSLPSNMLSELNVRDKFEYAENDLAIVYVGEPVNDWCDLRNRRVAIPNPITEGIGALFRELYSEYCGDYSELVGRGFVYLTRIHHREIPELLRNGLIDAGVVWRTEAIYWGFKYTVPSRNRVSRLSFALMPWQVMRLLRSLSYYAVITLNNYTRSTVLGGSQIHNLIHKILTGFNCYFPYQVFREFPFHMFNYVHDE